MKLWDEEGDEDEGEICDDLQNPSSALMISASFARSRARTCAEAQSARPIEPNVRFCLIAGGRGGSCSSFMCLRAHIGKQRTRPSRV
ncbi:unnamed protein product [Lampetra fluviatilis]